MKKLKENKILLILIVLAIVIAGLVPTFNHKKSNDEKKEVEPVNIAEEKEETEEDGVVSFDEVPTLENSPLIEAKVFDKIEYDITLDENIKEYMASKSVEEETIFYAIDEGDKYIYNDEYITLVKGVPYIVNKDIKLASAITDIKRIYLIIGDYNHNYILLTKDGEVYIGESYLFYNEDGTLRLANSSEWSKLDKLGTPNKYNEIRLVEFANSNNKSDDKIEYHLIGISKAGKRDLFIIKY